MIAGNESEKTIKNVHLIGKNSEMKSQVSAEFAQGDPRESSWQMFKN